MAMNIEGKLVIVKGASSGIDLREVYKMGIPADSVSRVTAFAIEQPADVELGEFIIRPTVQLL